MGGPSVALLDTDGTCEGLNLLETREGEGPSQCVHG